MSRSANNMNKINKMVVPGFDIIFDSITSLVITLFFIGFVSPQLLLMPLLFTLSFLISLRYYSRKLNPISDSMREQFGELNAGLTESVTGIEVVKATAQESQEQRKFELNASSYSDFY